MNGEVFAVDAGVCDGVCIGVVRCRCAVYLLQCRCLYCIVRSRSMSRSIRSWCVDRGMEFVFYFIAFYFVEGCDGSRLCGLYETMKVASRVVRHEA